MNYYVVTKRLDYVRAGKYIGTTSRDDCIFSDPQGVRKVLNQHRCCNYIV